MGDIVNLNKYRKRQQRVEQTRQAAENRVRFGRNKSERANNQAQQDRRAKDIDGKRLDDHGSDNEQ